MCHPGLKLSDEIASLVFNDSQPHCVGELQDRNHRRGTVGERRENRRTQSSQSGLELSGVGYQDSIASRNSVLGCTGRQLREVRGDPARLALHRGMIRCRGYWLGPARKMDSPAPQKLSSRKAKAIRQTCQIRPRTAVLPLWKGSQAKPTRG